MRTWQLAGLDVEDVVKVSELARGLFRPDPRACMSTQLRARYQTDGACHTGELGHWMCAVNAAKRSSWNSGKSVSWCFEPSQPQRILSGLKTNISLSPSYSAYESWNHIFFKSTTLVPTQVYWKHNIHTHSSSNKHFRRISSFGIAPVKKIK